MQVGQTDPRIDQILQRHGVRLGNKPTHLFYKLRKWSKSDRDAALEIFFPEGGSNIDKKRARKSPDGRYIVIENPEQIHGKILVGDQEVSLSKMTIDGTEIDLSELIEGE